MPPHFLYEFFTKSVKPQVPACWKVLIFAPALWSNFNFPIIFCFNNTYALYPTIASYCVIDY